MVFPSCKGSRSGSPFSPLELAITKIQSNTADGQNPALPIIRNIP